METFPSGAFAGLFGYPQAQLTISFCKAGGKHIPKDPLRFHDDGGQIAEDCWMVLLQMRPDGRGRDDFANV